MQPRRRSPAVPPARREGVLALVAALLLNLLIAPLFADAQPGGPLLAGLERIGTIEICSADGGVRIVLPDGSEAPAPSHRQHDGSCCVACVHACGAGCGVAADIAIAPAAGRGDPDLRLAAPAAPPAAHPFLVGPPSQGPPAAA